MKAWTEKTRPHLRSLLAYRLKLTFEFNLSSLLTLWGSPCFAPFHFTSVFLLVCTGLLLEPFPRVSWILKSYAMMCFELCTSLCSVLINGWINEFTYATIAAKTPLQLQLEDLYSKKTSCSTFLHLPPASSIPRWRLPAFSEVPPPSTFLILQLSYPPPAPSSPPQPAASSSPSEF